MTVICGNKKTEVYRHDPRDQAAVRNIATELAGNGLMALGITFNGKAEDVAKINLLRTLVEQNWIIIRQLDGLANKCSG